MENEDLYAKGEAMIQNEMNIFNLLQTIQKMKAAMSILIGEDTLKLRQINHLYMAQMKIYVNKDEEEAFKASKNKFMKFLEKD